MGSKMYVGGLPFSTTEEEVTAMFAPYGTVESAKVVTDKMTGQSRGFAFVEMSSPSEAQNAITALNGTQHEGRTLTVDMARPQRERTTTYGGGGGRRSY